MVKKREEIIDAQIESDDEVIEMAECEPGKYFPVAVTKIVPRELRRVPVPRPGFYGPPPFMETKPKMTQLLNGFIAGMEIVERFLDRVETVKKKKR